MTAASSLSYPVTSFPLIPDCLNVVLQMAGHPHFAQVSRSAAAFWRTDKCQRVHDAIFQAILFQKIGLQPQIAPSYLLQQVTCKKLRTRQIDPVYLINLHKELADKKNNGSDLNSILPVIKELQRKKDWISSYLVAHILGLSRLGKMLTAKDPHRDKYIIHATLSYSSWLILLQNPEMADAIIHLFQRSRYVSHLDQEGKKFCASAILGVYRRSLQRTSTESNDLTKQDCLAILTDLSENDPTLQEEINQILAQLSQDIQIQSKSSRATCPLETTAPPTPDPSENALRAIHKKRGNPKPCCCTLS